MITLHLTSLRPSACLQLQEVELRRHRPYLYQLSETPKKNHMADTLTPLKPAPAAGHPSSNKQGRGTHGLVRGLEHVPQSPAFEGRFGRMFRHLKPAAHTEDDLKLLGRIDKGQGGMTADADASPTPETNNPRDDEENT